MAMTGTLQPETQRNENQPLLGEEILAGLGEISIRHGFIQKVYGILGLQLAVTTAIGAAVMHFGAAWAKSNPTLVMTVLFSSMAVSVAMMFIFMCFPAMLRKSPQNYIILCVFTVAESIMVGFICIQYTQQSVLLCLGITAVVVCSLTLFACQTKYDFTGMGPYLFCAVMVLMGFSFIMMMGSWMGLGAATLAPMQMCYAAAGTLIFSMYIVYDTQLIVGNKHAKLKFGIDDYAMAAISLYIDIVQLFLMLLRLFGQRR